jgi:hypothetical protein
MQELIYRPVMYVNPLRTSVVWKAVNYQGIKKRQADVSNANLKSRVTDGVISVNVAKKIGNQIGWLQLFTKEKKAMNYKLGREFKFRLNFITLTLPSRQIHDDKVIKRECLNEFLIVAKRKWKLKDYVWRAETQANGNIHFHVIGDTFIRYDELRSEWNRIVEKLGYVSRFKENSNPNSTDIHSLKNIKNVVKYLIKYCTKNKEERRIVLGALWGSSDRLKNCKPCQIECSGKLWDKVQEKCYNGGLKYYAVEHCFLIKETAKKMLESFKEIREKIELHYKLYIRGFIEEIVKPKIEEICYSKSMAQPILIQSSLF